MWQWTPRQVDGLRMSEFWHFLIEFEKMQDKKKPKFNLKDPRYRQD